MATPGDTERTAFIEMFKATLADDRAARKQERDAWKQSAKTGGRVGRNAARARTAATVGGKVVASVAKNSATGAFVEGLQGAAQAVEKFGVAGKATAEVLNTAAVAVQTFKVVVDSFAERARELEHLSPDIAASSARADIRRMNTDMTEANAIGPQLAKLIELQSKTEAIFSATMLPIKQWALENVNAFLQWFMQTFADFVEGLNEGLKEAHLESKALASLVRRIRDIMEEKEGDPPLDVILKAGLGFAAPGRPPVPGVAADPGPPLLGAFIDGADAGDWRRRR